MNRKCNTCRYGQLELTSDENETLGEWSCARNIAPREDCEHYVYVRDSE